MPVRGEYRKVNSRSNRVILHQLQGLLEILVRFARKTDDNISLTA